MPIRTLRAANALLYASSVLLVIAATAYCAVYKNMPAWQQWGAIALCAAATVWGLYYVSLCYRIGTEGITRHVYFRCTRHLLWAQIERAEWEETEANGISQCSITLHPKDGEPLRLSSDVLNPDDLQEVAQHLRDFGLLPAADTPQEDENMLEKG